MQSGPTQPKPAPKKSPKTLIITLVSIFVIIPLIGIILAVTVAPSLRICAGVARTGQDVTALVEKNFDLLTYNYSCLGGTPPTTANQAVAVRITSSQTFASSDAFSAAVASDFQTNGWLPVAVASDANINIDNPQPQPSAAFGKNGYTATVTISSYQPALAQIVVRPDQPTANWGLVFGKSPAVPKKLSAADAARFLTVPTFIPQYIPSGYSAWSVDSAATGTAVMDQVIVNLQGGEGPVNPSLTIAGVPDGYDITADAELLTTTPGGIRIYLPASQPTSPVAIVNSSLVTFQYSYRHNNVHPQPSIDQIVKVFDSLEQTNTPAK